MKTKFATIALTLMTIFGAFSQTHETKKTSTIVIVHGAWSKAADWDGVASKLKAEGNEVISVNLPGHGKDNTSVATLHLQTYVDAVKKAIGTKKDIILVGHSFGGIVISQTAEQIPSQIKKLVYIAAYIPQNGQSLLSIAKTDPDSHVGKYLQVDEKNGIASIAKEGVVEVFAADAPKPVGEYIAANIKPEPLMPLIDTVSLSANNFGKISKSAVLTINDNTIGYSIQQKMAKDAAISTTYALPSSHTPFIAFSGVVTAIISQEAK